MKTGISVFEVFHDLKSFLLVYASPGHPIKGGKEEKVAHIILWCVWQAQNHTVIHEKFGSLVG